MWFDVSVNDVLPVKMRQTQGNLQQTNKQTIAKSRWTDGLAGTDIEWEDRITCKRARRTASQYIVTKPILPVYGICCCSSCCWCCCTLSIKSLQKTQIKRNYQTQINAKQQQQQQQQHQQHNLRLISHSCNAKYTKSPRSSRRKYRTTLG